MRNLVNKIKDFILSVDKDFPIHIRDKTDIDELSHKFSERGIVCIKTENEKIVAMAAGYANNFDTLTAYISLVATLSSHRGKGLASEVVREFLEKSRKAGMEKVQLHTHETNSGAILMYEKLGFYRVQSEREHDIKFEITL